MRCAFVLGAVLVARVASAQPDSDALKVPVDAGAGSGSSQPPAPQPGTAPATPPADQPAPKADPAYGDRPDHSIVDPAASDAPGIRRGRDIVVRYTPDRSKQNITLIAVLAGGAVAFGGAGLYFQFDARSSSDEVAAKTFTGHAWTPERQDTFDSSKRSSTIAAVAYGVGSALLLTTAIIYMITEPEQQELVISPHTNGKPIVAPTSGGAIVGGAWRF